MTVTLVAAVAENGAIGIDQSLPWDLPEDLEHFKKLTLGHVLVMGRATFESIGRALPGRTTVVVTRQPDWHALGVLTAADPVSAVELARTQAERVFVVGGAQIYQAVLDAALADEMVLTHVAVAPKADTYFPEFQADDWESSRLSESVGPPAFAIVKYRRRSASAGADV